MAAMIALELKEQIKKLPAKPGVYLFKNSRNKPLYAGKALDLKKRVGNYLKTDDPRLKKMVMEASDVGFIQTDSDIEALIIESQYIKKYQPTFNIMLRDDKQYSFVGFTKDKYPKIFITHQPQVHQDTVGPFTDAGALKTTLRLLRKIFPYCTCKQLHNNYCLNYHIEKCMGDCCLKIKNEKIKNQNDNVKLKNYRKNIKAIKDILSGKRKLLIKGFEKEMRKLSGIQEFEKALQLQYKIGKLKRVFQNAQIIGNWSASRRMEIGNSDPDKKPRNTLKQLRQILGIDKPLHRIEAYDIANIQGEHATGVMVVFENGQPNNKEYRLFKIKTVAGANDTAMLREILTRRFNHSEWQLPNLIVIDGGKAQLNASLRTINNLRLTIDQRPTTVALTKDSRHQGSHIYIQSNVKGKMSKVELNSLPSEVKNLILQIDSEAHRFAINYYRKLHRQSTR